MKIFACAILFACLVCSISSPLLLGQSPYTTQANETGMPAHGSFLASDIDSVNLANGALHVRIPFYSGKMRGNFSNSSGIRYESKFWVVNRAVNPTGNGGFYATYSWNTDLGAAGWQGDGEGYGLDFVTQDYSCAAPPPTYPWAYIKTKAGFMVRDGHGSVVKFPNRISRVYS